MNNIVKSTSKLFIFYKILNTKNRIIICAESYIEAKMLLFDLNSYADHIYNLIEYQLQYVYTENLLEICNIDPYYSGIPIIITESQYKQMEKYIINKLQSQLQHNKVLTKQYFNSLTKEIKPNVYSTNEFINLLKSNADIHIKQKKEIKSMLNTVGDIWFIKISSYAKKPRYVYGKSRYQCKKLVKDLNINERYTCPELLISFNGDNYDNIFIQDLDNYNKMVSYMKENNIKKFPFITSID